MDNETGFPQIVSISINTINSNCRVCSDYLNELVSYFRVEEMSPTLFEFIPVWEIIEFHLLPFLRLPTLEKGMKLVVKDTCQNWYLSTLLDIKTVVVIDDNHRECLCLFVHYDGWTQTWDEWIEWPNPRIRFVECWMEGLSIIDGVEKKYTTFKNLKWCPCRGIDRISAEIVVFPSTEPNKKLKVK